MKREIDDISKRKKFKDDRLGNKKTILDDYTGKRVNKKSIDIDHVVPVDEINRKFSKLSTEQRKRLANCDENLVVTKSSINRSKGCSSNSEYIGRMLDKCDKVSIEQADRMLEKQIVAEKAIEKKARKMKRENTVSAAQSLLRKMHK